MLQRTGFQLNSKDTGKFSNKRLFDLEAPETGSPDGLCVDDNEHVWSARWQKGEILEYSPTAEILTRIKFPKWLVLKG